LGQAPAAKARTDYRANTKIKAAPITIRALAVEAKRVIARRGRPVKSRG
jgi:hypothetical protein